MNVSCRGHGNKILCPRTFYTTSNFRMKEMNIIMDPNLLKASLNKNQVLDTHTIVDVGQKVNEKIKEVATIGMIALAIVVILVIILILKKKTIK